MRINKTNYPILAYLENPRNGIYMNIPEAEMNNGGRYKIDLLFREFFDNGKLASFYAQHIDIVSRAFIRAAFENRERIMTSETLEGLLKEPIWGVLICGNLQIVYYFRSVCRDEEGEMLMGSKTLVLTKNNFISVTNGDRPNQRYIVPRDYPTEDINEEYFETWPILFHLFKRYAEVEVVDAKMGKKVDIPDSKEKLLWEFDMPATYVDCSWFREIVRKEGFMVRGHFRLQPYKKGGEWTKKLIYIEPFQKHGYTRRAKIELQ